MKKKFMNTAKKAKIILALLGALSVGFIGGIPAAASTWTVLGDDSTANGSGTAIGNNANANANADGYSNVAVELMPRLLAHFMQ